MNSKNSLKNIVNNQCRSVTLKARVNDAEKMEELIFNLMDTIGNVTKQDDIYFNVPYGQMKLRISNSNGNNYGELISYKQTNNIGPNFSESSTSQVSDVQYLRNTLALSLTELGKLTKMRRTYIKNSIKINLDDVNTLGCFVDIDISCDGIILKNTKDLLAKAEKIQAALQLKESDLVPYSYYELYCQQQNENKNSLVNKTMSNTSDDCESGISEVGSVM